jgi:hypothetical protein
MCCYHTGSRPQLQVPATLQQCQGQCAWPGSSSCSCCHIGCNSCCLASKPGTEPHNPDCAQAEPDQPTTKQPCCCSNGDLKQHQGAAASECTAQRRCQRGKYCCCNTQLRHQPEGPVGHRPCHAQPQVEASTEARNAMVCASSLHTKDMHHCKHAAAVHTHKHAYCHGMLTVATQCPAAARILPGLLGHANPSTLKGCLVSSDGPPKWPHACKHVLEA